MFSFICLFILVDGIQKYTINVSTIFDNSDHSLSKEKLMDFNNSNSSPAPTISIIPNINITSTTAVPLATSLISTQHESIDTQPQNIFKYDDRNRVKVMHFIKDTQHKLLYCYIPKNSCTIFKHLFLLTNAKDDDVVVNDKIHSQAHKYEPKNRTFVADKLLLDEEWKSMVVLRDPLERLVSAYNNKCLKNATPWWCGGDKMKISNPSFRQVADYLISEIDAGNVAKINDHYRPQYTFCGLEKYMDYFDFIIYYDKATIASETLKYIENAGIDADKYYFTNWGEYHNDTMFATKTKHASNISQDTLDDKIAFYSQFYDKKLAMKVMSAFDTDYKKFQFPHPAWVEFL